MNEQISSALICYAGIYASYIQNNEKYESCKKTICKIHKNWLFSRILKILKPALSIYDFMKYKMRFHYISFYIPQVTSFHTSLTHTSSPESVMQQCIQEN
jgi:hypothetical protein